MGLLRPGGYLLLVCLLQSAAAAWLRGFGVCPALLSLGVCLAGLRLGPDRGAMLGLAAGLCAQWLAAGPQSGAFFLLALLGCGMGLCARLWRGFWGEWLGCLLGLAALTLVRWLGFGLTGRGFLAPLLSLAGPELLYTAVWFPLVWLVGRLLRPSRGRWEKTND